MAEGLRLLLVDDDAVDRARVRRLLDPGHVVVEAATADAARGAVEAAEAAGPPFDLVLLDVRLPDVDGVALLPSFEGRGLPVVMLTGVEETEVVVEAMQRGAQDYLAKGRMEAAGLERALRRAVETAALRRAVAEQRDRLAEQAATLEARNQEVRALASALTLAEHAERRRVAGLLHDHLQQLLFGAQLTVQSIQNEAGAETPIGQRTARAHEALETCIEVVRRLTLDLTPPVLDNEDVGVALRWLATHVEETYGLEVEVAVEDEVVVENLALRVLVTEVVRELLFNAVKHAETDRARVRVAGLDGSLTVTVADAGRGFDPEARPEDGFGLYSARGRLELVGGRLDLRSAPGAGTRATLTVPVDAA